MTRGMLSGAVAAERLFEPIDVIVHAGAALSGRRKQHIVEALDPAIEIVAAVKKIAQLPRQKFDAVIARAETNLLRAQASAVYM